MILTARLEKALATTWRIHQHQKRKGDNSTPCQEAVSALGILPR